MQVLTEKINFTERDAISFLEVMDIESGKRTVLKRFEHLIEAPNWTPDGTALLYNAGGKIYRYDIEKQEIKQIDTGFATNCNNDHVLSPDGTKIAVSHMTEEDWQSRVYIIPLAGGRPELITPMAPSYLHGWSPDGETLAYCAERNGSYDIHTIPVHGGTETRLTTAEGLNDGSEYSPDGKHIWFNSVRTGLMQVWRMNADGSSQKQMTFDNTRNSWFPHVSPDGKNIVYISYRKDDVNPGDHPPHKYVELRLMPYGGGLSKTLCELFGGQGTINVNSWSPCSKKFAFVSYKLKD